MPNKDGGWVLPEIVDPERVCVQLYIPNDFHHRSAFWGALYELTRWYNWQRDDEHTGILAANVWKEVWRQANDAFYAGQGCASMTRLRMSSECGILQVSYNGGTIWEDLVDLSSCISAGVAQGIQNALDDGSIAPPEQPGSVVRPQPGGCKSFNVELRGNSKWLLPMALSAGDTIEISGATGAWSDGTAIWGCPNGDQYFLGQCGEPRPADASDPMPTLPHMRLIGHYSDTYFDAMDGLYTVPVNVPDSQLELQMNDSSLSDNQGTVSFKVQVCRGAGEWFYTRDWTQVQTLGNWHQVQAQGWFPDEGGGYWGSAPGANRGIELYLQWEQERKVTTVVINYKAVNVHRPPFGELLNVNARLSGNLAWVEQVTHDIAENSTWSGEVTLTLNAEAVNYLPIRFELNGTGTLYIRSITINGEGGGLPTFI